MTNHIDAIRRHARAVRDGASDLTLALFRAYLVAAGAEVRGPWAYIPGKQTATKGFRAAAEYVLSLSDTAAFLRAMANAHDAAEREVGPQSLGQTPVYAADLNPVMPTVDDLTQVAQHISELAAQLATVATPRAFDASEVTVVAGPEAPVSVLDLAQRDVVERMVRRAQYDALREMLSMVDSWAEGVIEEGEARELRDRPRTAAEVTFHVEDVRNMINDAARAIGAREPYRRPSP